MTIRRSTMIIISSITVMMTTGACAPRNSDPEAAFRESLVRHYAEDDKAARAMNGEPLRLEIAFVDLDGDGKPEAIVLLDHPVFCSSHGCVIDVLRFLGDRIGAIGAFTAHEVTPRHEVIGQQPHLVVACHLWTVRSDRLTTE